MAKKRTATDTDQESTAEQPSFEEAMEQLESLVQRLELGGGALEQALDDYAAAIGLLKSCNGRLEAAERRVQILSGCDAQGNPVTQPLVETSGSLEQKQQARSSRRTAPGVGEASPMSPADDAGLF